jgi:hypothetical protein
VAPDGTVSFDHPVPEYDLTKFVPIECEAGTLVLLQVWASSTCVAHMLSAAVTHSARYAGQSVKAHSVRCAQAEPLY